MAGYLNRLIQRVSGQAPVVMPLLRSSYASLPLFNEATTEFEQTVSFNEDANSPVSELPRPTLPHQETQTTRQPVAGEQRELPNAGESSEAKSTIDSSRTSVPRLSNSLARGSQKEKSESSPRKISNSNQVEGQPYTNQTGNKATEPSTMSVFERQPVQDNARNVEKVRRQKQVSPQNGQGIFSAPSQETKLSGESIQKHDTEDVPMGENATAPRLENAPRIVASRDRRSPQETETIKRVDLVRQSRPLVNIMQDSRLTSIRAEQKSQDVTETSSAINVRVTIGRVEIKAVPPPERQNQRIPSAPQRPAVSLDAYIKRRDEERR